MARETLWLCLHLPRLGLEHWLKSDPEGGGALPRALSEAGRLTQLNLPARAQGLKPAMALSTALSICQSLETRPRDIPTEQRTLRLLADWAYALSPEVSISKNSNILVQIADSIQLFNGAERIQEAAVAGLQAQGYSVSASLGPTPLGAQALAEAGQGLSLERLQSALQDSPEASLKARWVHAVHAQASSALDGLSPACLFPSGPTAKLLDALGLHHLGALRALPRGALRQRLGVEATQTLEQLWGTQADLRVPLKPRRTFYRDQPFLEDVLHRGGLRFPLKRLCGELAQWLRDRQLQTDRLQWRLQHRDHGSQFLKVTLAEPQGQANAFYELSWLQLSRSPLLPAVDRLTLRVTALSPFGGESTGLFQGPRREGQEPPHALLGRLFARLGQASCYGLSTYDDPRPEQGTVRCPPPTLRAPSPGKAPRKSPGKGPAEPHQEEGAGWRQSPRPLWVLAQPRRLGGQTTTPAYQGTPLKLQQGPERLSYGWWAPPEKPGQPGPNRDYWVAQGPRGAWLWVFQDRASQAWYLHGLFA
ncbi:MAG: hypothetical protein RLZZ174_14 [Pseudomonadota bacterium]|jgi:protein ImuB|nr:DNA polymerase Y family protein [Pseudomonadales bacterium]